jgi:hypothetical protein
MLLLFFGEMHIAAKVTPLLLQSDPPVDKLN